MKKQLMLVAMLSVGTALTTMGRVKPVAASLTPPTTYDYSYTWNATDSEQYLNVNGVDSIPLYTRTADGIYFNYTTTFNVIDGLSVTQTFNRSNTAWQVSGTTYKPDEDKIGSDSNVGSVVNKIYLKFHNQTNKDYYLYLDVSSSIVLNYQIIINDYIYISNREANIFSLTNDNYLVPVYISAYSFVEFKNFASSSGTLYFDAWYLQDLGISDSYQAGLDAETQGILTDYLGTDAQQIGWVLIGIAAILFAFKGGK
jgi:hypothetical protein